MPSPEYYHRQADLCLRMALLASEYEERLRLLDIANGYRDDAVRVEAMQTLWVGSKSLFLLAVTIKLT